MGAIALVTALLMPTAPAALGQEARGSPEALWSRFPLDRGTPADHAGATTLTAPAPTAPMPAPGPPAAAESGEASSFSWPAAAAAVMLPVLVVVATLLGQRALARLRGREGLARGPLFRLLGRRGEGIAATGIALTASVAIGYLIVHMG